jgi:uncharacterized membrane protein
MEKSAVFNSKLLPYALLVPQLIITFVFFYWPASQAVWQSFLREDAFGLRSEFIGLENYQALFAQPEYYKAMLTTLVFSTLVAVLRNPGRQEPESRPVLQDLHDLALCGSAGGGRRAVVLHVSPFARHAGTAAALDGVRLESAAERQSRHDPGGDGRGVEADLL